MAASDSSPYQKGYGLTDAFQLSPEDELSRFAVEKGYYRADNTVKPKAFEPQRRVKDGVTYVETSVFNISGYVEAEIWALSDSEVATARRKPVIARADISVCDVQTHGLRAENAEPPIRHVVIVDWPIDESEIEAKMKELAASAKLIVR